MSNPADLKLPPLGLMRRYLLANGWNRREVRDGALDLFTLKSEGVPDIEVVLTRAQTPDTDRRLVQALRTLAGLSGRDEERVSSDVAMFDFDVLRARLPDSMVLRDSIQLKVAEKFIGNARRFLVSAAAAELRRTVFVQDNQEVGGDYAASCRFGHTFHGSFGFAIESPAGTSAETLDGEPAPAPYERRVVERIARGLATLEDAARLGSHDPLLKAAEEGVGLNLNMLNDFTNLLADTSAHAIAFDITLTPAWPMSSGIILVSEIPQTVLDHVGAAVSILKPPSFSDVETIVGKVVRLETRENPADLYHEGTREILVEGESSGRGALSVRVRLSPEPYLIAVDAHRNGKLVKVVGLVNRSSRGSLVTDLNDFRVV